MERKNNITTTVIIFILLGTFAYAQWATVSIDTLSASSYEKRITMQAIAIDNNQTLHAVWAERVSTNYNRIYYSQKPLGSNWSLPQIVADSTGLDQVMGIESTSGKVHIAYTISGTQYNEVCYATNRSGDWQRTQLTSNTVYDHAPTITVNDTSVHIAWITTDNASAYKLKYTNNLTGAWTQQVLAGSNLGGFGTGAAPYISVSPEGVAHISYRGGDYGNYHIHHAQNSFAGDTNWIYEILYTMNANDFTSALKAKSSGEVFLVCSGNDGWGFPFRTCYLHRPANSVNWDACQLMTSTMSATLRGFAMDGNTTHISWEQVNGNILMENIFHCTDACGNWLNSSLLADGQTTYGALVIDNNHQGHALVASGPSTSSQRVYCINSAPLTAIQEQPSIYKVHLIKLQSNPVRSPVNFLLRMCTQKEIQIYSAVGRLIKNLTVTNNTVTWNGLDNWGRKAPIGSYIAKYENNVIGFVLIR